MPHHKSLQGMPSDRALVPVTLASEQHALRQREEAEEVEEYEEEREARRSERAMVTRREAKHVALSEVEEAGRTSPGARAVDFGGARRPRRWVWRLRRPGACRRRSESARSWLCS